MPPPETEAPMPRASDDENASSRTMFGFRARRPRLVSSLHMTPEDVIAIRLETSKRSGSASRARSMGLAKASPTMASTFTRSRPMVSRSSTGS